MITIVFLVGCKSNTTPTGVVALSAEYAQKDELDDFRSTLMGNALKNFGNVDAMRNFVDKLFSYSNFDLDENDHTHTVIGRNKFVDTYDLKATAQLSGNETPIVLGTLSVTCYGKITMTRPGKRPPMPRKSTRCYINDILLDI